MKHYSGFLLATLLATAEVHAQLQQTCMVVDGYFYYLSEAGFVQTADGGFASAGPFSETNDGYNEIGVTRFDANGELLWLRKWTTGANDNIFPQALVATADGGLVLAGIDQATPPQSGWFIMKLDASGTLQWSKNYDSPTFSLIGSLYADGFRQTSDGGFAVVAFKQFPDHGFCMFRTDANGELLWSDEIRYTGTLCDIAELPNGDLVIAGESNNDATLLARKDGLTGVTEWVHWYSCTTEDFTPFAVTAGPDSTIVVSGRCSGYMPGDFGSIGAMALDAQGTPQWMTKVVTADEAQGFEVARDPTGGWVIAGHTTVPLPGSGELAPSVTKLSETGLLEWSKRYAFTPGIVNSWFSRISFADDGDLLVTGRTAAVNSYVQRLLKLAPDGSTCPYCPAQDSGTYVALVPQFAPDEAMSEPGAWATSATLTLTMTDLTASALAEACGTTAISELGNTSPVLLSPNPMIDHTAVSISDGSVRGTLMLQLFDATGRIVREQPITGNTAVIARGDLAAGGYAYRLVNNAGIIAQGKLQVVDR